ncbi:MAG: tetratricopeptide repeat protein, partial [Actinomycetales bacterium]
MGGIDEDDALDLLESLADKSLLTPVRGHGEPRYRMLETLREFGTEQLVESGPVTMVRRTHLAHVVRMLEHHAPLLRGPEQLRSLDLIDVEWGNVAAALRFAIDVHDRAGAGQILQTAAWYWAMRGQEDELAAWIGEVMALPPSDDPASEVLLHGLAIVGEMSRSGRTASADEHVAAILAAYDTGRAHGHWVEIVMHVVGYFGRLGGRTLPEPSDLWTRSVISIMHVVLGDNAGTGPADPEKLRFAIEGFREVGDRSGLASALTSFGSERALDGHLDEAVATWREAQGMLEELGAGEDLSFVRSRIIGVRLVTAHRDELDALRAELLREEAKVSHERGRWILRATLAEIEVLAGRPQEAVLMLEEQAAEDGGASLGSSQARAALLGFLARAYVAAGRLDDAQETVRKAFQVGELVEDMPILAGVARAVAHLSRARGHTALAARQLGASDQLRGRQDLSVRDGLELTATLRDELGPEGFERELEPFGTQLVTQRRGELEPVADRQVL